jgi:hypothetical protein
MQAGLQLIPFGLGILFVGPWAGMAADRMGVRYLLLAGVFVQLASVIGLAYIQPDTNYWLIALALLVAGVAQGEGRMGQETRGGWRGRRAQDGKRACFAAASVISPPLIRARILFALFRFVDPCVRRPLRQPQQSDDDDVAQSLRARGRIRDANVRGPRSESGGSCSVSCRTSVIVGSLSCLEDPPSAILSDCAPLRPFSPSTTTTCSLAIMYVVLTATCLRTLDTCLPECLRQLRRSCHFPSRLLPHEPPFPLRTSTPPPSIHGHTTAQAAADRRHRRHVQPRPKFHEPGGTDAALHLRLRRR